MFGGEDEEFWRDRVGSLTLEKAGAVLQVFTPARALTLTNPPSTADFLHSSQSNSPCWPFSLFVVACMHTDEGDLLLHGLTRVVPVRNVDLFFWAGQPRYHLRATD